MPSYMRTDAYATAVCHDGNFEMLEAAARLGGEPAPDGRFSQRADGVSPRRSFAVWNRRKRSWDNAMPGDWIVVDPGGARVLKAEDFTAQYRRVD